MNTGLECIHKIVKSSGGGAGDNVDSDLGPRRLRDAVAQPASSWLVHGACNASFVHCIGPGANPNPARNTAFSCIECHNDSFDMMAGMNVLYKN